MTNYYLDPYNGSDGNNGTSRTTPKKSPANLCATYVLAAGDEVRVAKDCEIVTLSQTASYSSPYSTRYIQLDASIDVYDFLNAFATGETFVANSATQGTFTANNTALMGTGGPVSISSRPFTLPASPALNTKYFYIAPVAWDTTPIDLSPYQEIWGYVSTTGATVPLTPDGTFRICLCSDVNGDTIVDDLPMEFLGNRTAPLSGASYIPFRAIKAGGANLGSSIKSVAFYSGTSAHFGASKTMTVFGAIYGIKTDGPIKPYDFLWFNKSSRTGVLTVNSAIYAGTSSTPRIYMLTTGQTSMCQQFFTGAEIKRLRPRYRKSTDTEWTETYSKIVTNLPYGASGNPIKWIGGWDMSATDARNGYTTFGNWHQLSVYAFVGMDLAAQAYWHGEGFVIGHESALFFVNYITHWKITASITDCVVTGTDGVIIDRHNTTTNAPQCEITAVNLYQTPGWSTPPIGNTAQTYLFRGMRDGVTNANILMTYCSISDSCVNGYAVSARYLTSGASGTTREITNVTFQNGAMSGNGTLDSRWQIQNLSNVVFIGAGYLPGCDTVYSGTHEFRFDNLRFTNNGYIDSSAGGGWVTDTKRGIYSATNWVFDGEHDGTARTVYFEGPTGYRVTLNNLDLNATGCVLRVSGGVDITGTVLIRGSSTLELKGDSSTLYSSSTGIPIVYDAVWTSTNTSPSFSLQEGVYKNTSFTWPDAISSVNMGTCSMTFIDCTFRTVTGGTAVQKGISYGGTTARTVLKFENCTFNGLWFSYSASSYDYTSLRFESCTFTGLNGTNYDIKLTNVSYWPSEIYATDTTWANGGIDKTTLKNWRGIDRMYFDRNRNKTKGLHQIFGKGGYASTQTALRHTASGYAWLYQSYGSGGSFWGASEQDIFPLVRVAVKDGSPVKVSVWFYLGSGVSHAHLFARKKQISETQAELKTTITTAGSWQKAEVTFTPNATGIIEFQVYFTTIGGDDALSPYMSVYWDDIEVVNA